MPNGEITPQDLERMVSHWLGTPAGSYLGSSYGHNIKRTLQKPMSNTEADEVLAKMRADIPLLQLLPAGSVFLYTKPDGVDRTGLYIEVAGRSLAVP